MFTACGIKQRRCCLQAALPVHYTAICKHKSSAPEDERNYRPKYVEPIEIIKKNLVSCVLKYLGAMCTEVSWCHVY